MVKITNTQKSKLIKNLIIGSQARKNRIFAKFLHSYKESQKNKYNNSTSEKTNFQVFKSVNAYEIDYANKMQQIKLLVEINKKNLRYAHKDFRIYYDKNPNIKIKQLPRSKKHIFPSCLSYSCNGFVKKYSPAQRQACKKLFAYNYNRKIMLFILGECDLTFNALSAQINKFSTGSACPLKVTKKTNLIFQQLISFIEYMTNLDMYKIKIPKTEEIIRSKILIENACLCLDAIAELNQNRFIFRNLDIPLKCNKILLSRLVLNTCYHILNHCERQSTIEVISYCEDKKFTIEFLTKCEHTKNVPLNNGTWRMFLKEINGSFSYETTSEGETAFKLTVPYENTRF